MHNSAPDRVSSPLLSATRPVALLSQAIHRDSSQVHFVSVADRTESARREASRFRKPQPIVLHRNHTPVPQQAEKSPLQRRQRYERPIQIKERCNGPALLLCILYFLYLLSFLHAASCAALFVPRTGLTFPAMYFHPSNSTGNPRSRQNPAVIDVSICAPM